MVTIWMILVSGFFLILFLSLRYAFKIQEQRRSFIQRVKAFGGGLKSPQKINKESLIAYSRENKMQKRLKAYFQKGDGRRIRLHPSLRLQRAGLTLNYTQFILFGILVYVAFSLSLFMIFTVSFWVCLVGGFFFAVFFLHRSLKMLEERRQRRFLRLLPDALDMLLRSLRAGVTVERGFQLIVKEINEPVGSEFRSICEQLDVGVTFEQALKDAADRLNLSDFDFFVVTLIIQRSTGGGLTDVLSNIILTLRKREELRLKIKALSSESWTTASIIGALPVVIFLAMHFIRPGYYDIFDTDPMGQKMKWAMIICAVSGLFSVRHIIRFESD